MSEYNMDVKKIDGEQYCKNCNYWGRDSRGYACCTNTNVFFK